MPVGIGIMMKFSEVLNDGHRWPKNYYEQLQRCFGLMPINVFATINNRWIINKTAEESWDAEFLSERITKKATQYRASLDSAGFIFTRAGALLNLKLLL